MGNIVGMAGMLLKGNKRGRRKMAKTTKVMATKIGQFVDDLTDML